MTVACARVRGHSDASAIPLAGTRCALLHTFAANYRQSALDIPPRLPRLLSMSSLHPTVRAFTLWGRKRALVPMQTR